jgi:HTH-type transcriptional regulator/antitoxin HigA
MNTNFQQITEAWKAFADVAHVKRAQTETDYLRLLELMDDLTDYLAERGEAAEDSAYGPLFDLLADYMLEWEKGEPIPETSGAEALRFLMAEHGLSQYQLAREGLADQSTLSKILAGKRKVSRELAKKLGTRFHVTPAVFL